MKMMKRVTHRRKRIYRLRQMKYRLDHHHSYSSGGILYVKSWVSSLKHGGTGWFWGIFFTKYPHYKNWIYVYMSSMWRHPKMGPPTT